MAGQDEKVEARVAALSRAGWVPTDPDAGHDRPDPTGADRPADLRDRALRVALSSYVAAHGHPLDHTTGAGPVQARRWLPSRRAVLAAAAVLALLTAVVVGRALLAVPSTVVTAADDGSSPVALPGAALEASDGSSADPLSDDHSGGGQGDGATAPDDTARSGEDATVVVHVVGAVVEPGLVELSADARVADALEAAGGPVAEADLTAVNLARAVVDGEQIHVPLPGEAPPAGHGHGASGEQSGGDTLVDLNRADVVGMEALPGVGPVLAERIVAWRDEHGPFRSIDELTEVSGIGPAVLEKLRDHVRVG